MQFVRDITSRGGGIRRAQDCCREGARQPASPSSLAGRNFHLRLPALLLASAIYGVSFSEPHLGAQVRELETDHHA
jgi:hypothetical protein